MLDIIKKASLGAVSNSNPVSFAFGEVTAAQPLSVTLDQRLTLSGAALAVSESVAESKVQIGTEEVLLRRGLEAGDKVLLARMQGGQRYIVLDRLVDSL